MSERSIFLAALEIEDAAAREAFLRKACGNNPQLQSEVEALLQSHTSAGAFLDTPAAMQLGAGSPTVLQRSDAGTAELLDEVEAAVLSLLQPADKPGVLGRLGHYDVLEVLGKGAFGIVLKAFDEKLHRMVAIKTLNPELAATSPPRKRFLREARTSAAVRHENIVAIHAVEEQPIPHLVMEYVPGLTLQQWLDQHGPLDVADVLRIGQQIATGLAAAHAQGLIHRDIKPSNILLETGIETRAKITDFGLARAADDASLTQSGVIAGTPLFMAPEQAKGLSLDHRADLFSLGSVLYTMVSGRPPFRAPNTMAVLKRVCEDTPRPIPEIIAETPTWLCDIIAKLQAKEPEDRFQSAKEVADLLGQHLAHRQQPHEVPRPPAIELPGTRTDGVPELSREAVLAKLRGPAWGLIATVCLSWTWLFLGTPAALYFAAQSRWTAGIGPAELLVLFVLCGLPTGAILLGALKMFRGESYAWCLTASVLALLIPPGFLLGLPMGIWALFTLSQPEIRRSFEGNVSRREAMWASASGWMSFLGTFLLFVLISAGVVWWGAELTGVSSRTMHGVLAAGAFVALVVASIAESMASRREADDAARIFAGIAGAAALIGAGNGLMMRMETRTSPAQTAIVTQPDVTPLERMVELAKRDHAAARQRFETQAMSAFELAESEIRVAEAELRLAEALEDWEHQETLFARLLQLHAQRLDVMQLRAERGAATLAEVYETERPLLEVQRRWNVARAANGLPPKDFGNVSHGTASPASTAFDPFLDAAPPAIAPFDEAQARQHQEQWAEHLGVPVRYTNGLGMAFRLIPPGDFLMGSTPAELEKLSRDLAQSQATDYEKFVASASGPQHAVRISQPFYLGEHEVTIGQYRQFIETTKYIPTMDQLRAEGFRWEDAARVENADRRAVVGVSWDDAQAFCAWLTRHEEVVASLPTEARWEFACRAGTTTLWSFGDDPSRLDEYAVTDFNVYWPAAEVGSRKPNPFGLFDMHGNAEEWCFDWHQRDFYARSPRVDPVCVDSPHEENSGRVVRGGGLQALPWRTRSTTRPWDFPASPTNPKGFRVVLDVQGVKTRLQKLESSDEQSVSAEAPENPR